jgi:hypothetical protein
VGAGRHGHPATDGNERLRLLGPAFGVSVLYLFPRGEGLGVRTPYLAQPQDAEALRLHRDGDAPQLRAGV